VNDLAARVRASLVSSVVPASFGRPGYAARAPLFDPRDLEVDLTGESIGVTGGTSGIGLATAHALAALGANVTLFGRDAAKGEAAARAVTAATGRSARFVRCDVGDLASVRQGDRLRIRNRRDIWNCYRREFGERQLLGICNGHGRDQGVRSDLRLLELELDGNGGRLRHPRGRGRRSRHGNGRRRRPGAHRDRRLDLEQRIRLGRCVRYRPGIRPGRGLGDCNSLGDRQVLEPR